MIKDLKARRVLDSRGRPTIEIEIHTESSVGIASAPSGASRGMYEAVEIKDVDDRRFLGYGVYSRISLVERIREHFIGTDENFRIVDHIIRGLDGTPDKRILGGNLTIAISIAAAKAYAASMGVEPFEIFNHRRLPGLLINMIEGGKHARNQLGIQEFMIVLDDKPEEALRKASEIYLKLGEILRRCYLRVCISDEGAYDAPMNSSFEALDAIMDALESLGYDEKIALDAAASHFYHKGKYHIDGKSLDAHKLAEYYEKLAENYPIVMIEDPFHERYPEDFGRLKLKTIADYLTVTNASLIEKYHEYIDGVIIKPNQAGTLSETIAAVEKAKEYGLITVASNRSGETDDPFIVDFAVGMGLDYLKAGAPARERIVKYNRLLRIADLIS